MKPDRAPPPLHLPTYPLYQSTPYPPLKPTTKPHPPYHPYPSSKKSTFLSPILRLTANRTSSPNPPGPHTPTPIAPTCSRPSVSTRASTSGLA